MPHQKTERVNLPKRDGAPSSSIFTRLFIKNNLGDRNTIILLPGGPGNDMSMYDAPEMSLTDTFFKVADVILFDPRNCGKSGECPIELCSLDHYIDDVEAIRQHFNINPDHFFVFGQSYGAIAALGYAIRYANSLKKLLLIGGVVSSAFYSEARAHLEKIATPEQIKFAQKLWHGSFNGSKQEVADYYALMSPLYSYTFEPGEPPLDIGCNVDILNYGWGDFLQNFDYTDTLSNVTCDTLILWGENEWMMPKTHIDKIHHTIKNCTLKTYPKCMHMLWMDQWDMFVHDALTFLK
jgi:proline iminopeptidase